MATWGPEYQLQDEYLAKSTVYLESICFEARLNAKPFEKQIFTN